jgi:hypothetical protein
MMARMIPESIKMKLKKRLEESCAGSDDKREVIERIRERLRARMNEAKSDSFDRGFIKRIRRRLEERMRKRGSVSEELREKLRERLRRRLRGISERREGSIIERIRRRMRAGRMSEGRMERGYDRGFIEHIRRRLEERMNKRVGISEELGERTGCVGVSEELRRRLRERLARVSERRDSSIIERIRERMRSRKVLSEGGSSIRNPRIMGLSDAGYDEEDIEMVSDKIERLLRSRRRIGEGKIDKRLEVYGAVIRKLKKESERRRAMLKEAYKVIKRVEELGGIDKIEKSLKLAHDTIVKAGSKMFKEAVDKLAVEAGVDKEEAAKILRKLGLKEAKEMLKKGVKKVKEKKTEVIPVSGLVKEESDSPIIAKRLAERLARGNEIPGMSGLKEMTEAVFDKKL